MFGVNPTTTGALIGYGIASGAFQVGLLFLIRALFRSRALGEGRWPGRCCASRPGW